MLARVLVVLVIAGLGILYVLGTGLGVETWHAGSPQAREISPRVVAKRAQRIESAAREVGVAQPKQILFGDLHVHTTFSFDAFQMSLPMAGGDGAYPVADACDYARHCSALDFWSINDHGITLTPRRWKETIESVRQCNAVAGAGPNPDLVSYLGWEWTQVGTMPENHWGHKNVIVRELDDGKIPTRPISAGTPPGMPSVQEGVPSPLLLGLLVLGDREGGGPEFVKYISETASIPDCPSDVPVRELPLDCREVAPTPQVLFEKLDDWGYDTMVIPHGTTWGYYTPLGASWDKQLTPEQWGGERQAILEVFSGHGNSEEFRPFSEVTLGADGTRTCPEPQESYLPSCWRAGESEEECAGRAATARQHFVDAEFNGGGATVPGTTVGDWRDAGQCRDCFQPAFNYRPKSSVQYLMALGRQTPEGDPLRFRFGFIASSDNHSARPGTGYKEAARTAFTETRFGNFLQNPLGRGADKEPRPRSKAVELGDIRAPFLNFETERQASFFLNGGLAAVHAAGRDRDAIWEAMQRREVYGTSGPRILLWFDLLNAPGGHPAPMGSEVAIAESPITRIEVVRIRPQRGANEAIEGLVEDPWKVLECSGDPVGCQVAFTDEEFRSAGRDALYYVRAIEAPSLAVGANPLGCSHDESGRCVEVSPCFGRPDEDECLAETEERAWSSPIFVNQAGS